MPPVPSDLFPVQRRPTRGFRVFQVLIQPVFATTFRFRITGRRHLPTEGGYIVVANHLSWVDSFVIGHILPTEPRVHFLADADELEGRWFEWNVLRHIGGYLPLSRGRVVDRSLYRRMGRCLADGCVVAIYPEASYGKHEGDLLPFANGFAHFARRFNVPVVPIALSGCRDLWFRKQIRVAVGPQIPPTGSVAEIVDQARASILRMLPEYHEPPGPKLLRRQLTNLFD